jgi:hypothetical protein
MARCYIVQDLGKIDFLPAEQHGELVICIRDRVTYTSLPRAFERLRNVMRDIKADDWIIACGAPALIALAGAIMAQRTGRVRVLSWDQQHQRYIPSDVPA